jgi:hypothetical protein
MPMPTMLSTRQTAKHTFRFVILFSFSCCSHRGAGRYRGVASCNPESDYLITLRVG